MYKPYKMTALDTGTTNMFFNAGGYKSITFIMDDYEVNVPTYDLIGGDYYYPLDDTEVYPVPTNKFSFDVEYKDPSLNKDWSEYASTIRTLRNAYRRRHVLLEAAYHPTYLNRDKATCVCISIDAKPKFPTFTKANAIIYTFAFQRISPWTVV